MIRKKQENYGPYVIDLTGPQGNAFGHTKPLDVLVTVRTLTLFFMSILFIFMIKL